MGAGGPIKGGEGLGSGILAVCRSGFPLESERYGGRRAVGLPIEVDW